MRGLDRADHKSNAELHNIHFRTAVLNLLRLEDHLQIYFVSWLQTFTENLDAKIGLKNKKLP